MGLFIREDPGYDVNVRQEGFNRYKQLLSLRTGRWLQVNLVTLAGAVPLAAGIGYALLSSSLLVLLPCSLLGGMLFGPFLAGLYDAVLRGLRDDPLPWRRAWARSWRSNWRDSLLPGAVLGLFTGLYAFMAHLFWWSQAPVGRGTLALSLGSLLLLLSLGSLYWPQVVLFRQRPLIRLQNALLFALRNPKQVLGTSALLALYLAVLVLFAPWTVLLLPVTGLWYPVFVVQLLLYPKLSEALGVGS